MICNAKVILLCGFQRGGTSLVWNLIASHPDICAAGYETGELFQASQILRRCRYEHQQIEPEALRRLVDRELHAFKLHTLEHDDDRYRADGLLYTQEQVAAAALCLKSVNDDIFLTDLLQQVYPDLYVVVLARNGYALGEGYVRRGRRTTEAARTYQRIGAGMQRLMRTAPHAMLLRFEDVLTDPFGAAEELFRFLKVTPIHLDKIRLKSKKVIGVDGDHMPQFGEEHRKYWFDRATVGQALAADIDAIQAARLSPDDIAEIDRLAGDTLRYFGYT